MIDLMDLVRSIAAEAARAEENTNHPLPCTPGSPLLASVRQACVERGFTASGEGEPAAAPQVVADERAALVDPDQVPYLIYFDDADRKTEMVIGGTRARYRFKQISGSWNAHLFAKIASNSLDDKYPCASLAAPVQAQEPKPFAGPGAWFSVDVLGNPMREYSPGKWESSVWPSVTPVQPVAVLDGDWKRLGYKDEADYLRKCLSSSRALVNAYQSILAERDKEIIGLKLKLAAPAAQGDAKDAERLEFIENGTFDLRCYNDHDDDVYWNVIEHHMAAPIEREIGWGNTARQAIDAAIAAKAVKS